MRNRKMLRYRRVVALALSLVMFISLTGCKKEDSPLIEQSMEVTDANDAITQLANAEADYGYENALSELTEKSSSTIDGDSYYRLQQNYKGIPVYGRTIICATDEDGSVTSITGNAIDVDTRISLAPTIALEQATLSASNYMEENLGYDVSGLQIDSMESDSLCIFIADGGYTSRLAYCMNIGDLEIVIDANNADVLHASRTVYEETATGYTASDTNRTRGFSIEKLGEYYYVMSDTSRGLSVFTFAGRISQDNTGFHRDRATIVESTDEVFGNTEVETALEYEKGAHLLLYVSSIYDYFFSLGFSSSATDTNLYYNDGYDKGENALGGKVDGYGVISMGSTTGVNCVDVIAHEYTHFVSRELVGWSGNAENGALNEAMSDIFGEILESFVIGSDINWHMDEFRNIAEPSAHKHPDFYKGDNWGDTSNPTKENDYGYVHNNSTVISHTAYLMWNGIDGTDSKRISTDDLAELWYRAMLMMPSNCDFSDCRQIVELAATSMELTTTQIECVSESFDAVGVTRASKENFRALYDLALDSTLSVYGGDGELYDNYTLNITGNTTIYGPVTEKINSSYNRTRTITNAEPYELNLPQGIYIFTITDNANPNATSAFTVCVQKNDGDANIDIFTNFGCTPVKGTVSEIKEVNGVDTNVPITSAVVKVYSHAQESVVETILMSETEGFFEVYLPIGNYSFAVEAEGYISSTTSFELTSEQAEYLELILEPDVELVTDAYTDAIVDGEWTYCYHIPQVNLSGNRGEAFNTKIYDKFYKLLSTDVYQSIEEYDYPYLSQMVYTWGQKDNLVSIILQTDQTMYAWTDFYVYTISADTGAEISYMELLPMYDLSETDFYNLVKETLKEYWDSRKSDMISFVGEDYYNALVERTIAEENVKNAIPYINSNGELCFVAYVYSAAGAEKYLHLLNTTGTADEGWIECTIDHFAEETQADTSDYLDSLCTKIGLTSDAAKSIVDIYVPFCKNLSSTFASSDGSVAEQRSCLVVDFVSGTPNLVVHYWVPDAYSPGQFCEAWIIYGIENGEVVEVYSDENFAPTRREIAMVYNESYRFALREDQTISGANYYELIIHYPNNVTDTSMYEDYNYIQLSEDSHVLRVWTISGDYVDISF